MPPEPSPPPVIDCVECRGAFPESEIVYYGDHPICFECKDVVLDKLKMGGNVGNGPWRLGRSMLVLPAAGQPLAPICLKCGEAATERTSLGRTSILVPLCQHHHQVGNKWKWVRIFGIPVIIAFGILSFALVIVAGELSSIAAFAGAVGLTVMNGAVLLVVDRASKSILRVARTDRDYVYVTNAGRKVLRELPVLDEK